MCQMIKSSSIKSYVIGYVHYIRHSKKKKIKYNK